ncbi:MAG TPA: hypothetical protein VHI13_09235 [Candidatus Kapabacteria bacterium]|nr:hypothetical protein [Candidatus Kapabacteria bacterium]
MPVLLLSVSLNNHAARSRVILLAILAGVLAAGALALLLLGAAVVGGLARWYFIPAVLAVLVLILLVAAARRLRSTLELYRDDRGIVGARLLSRGGREEVRVDGPLRVDRGAVPIGGATDLMLCFAGGGDTFPIVIHCDASNAPRGWSENWGRLSRSIWRRVATRHRCPELPEVARLLDAERPRVWRE